MGSLPRSSRHLPLEPYGQSGTVPSNFVVANWSKQHLPDRPVSFGVGSEVSARSSVFSVKMYEIDSKVLISLMESKPVLWGKTQEVFKDRNPSRNAWSEVCFALEPDFDVIDKNLFGGHQTKYKKVQLPLFFD